MEVGYPQNGGQRILPNKRFVESPTEGRLDAEGLQNEDAHADDALSSWIVLGFHGVVDDKNYEVMRSVCIDNEAPEAFVALEQFPKYDKHLRSPG